MTDLTKPVRRRTVENHRGTQLARNAVLRAQAIMRLAEIDEFRLTVQAAGLTAYQAACLGRSQSFSSDRTRKATK